MAAVQKHVIHELSNYLKPIRLCNITRNQSTKCSLLHPCAKMTIVSNLRCQMNERKQKSYKKFLRSNTGLAQDCGISSAFATGIQILGHIICGLLNLAEPCHLSTFADYSWVMSCGIKLDFTGNVKYDHWNVLTHWGQNKMVIVLQTTFSNVFSSINIFEFLSLCHLFPMGPMCWIMLKQTYAFNRCWICLEHMLRNGLIVHISQCCIFVTILAVIHELCL